MYKQLDLFTMTAEEPMEPPVAIAADATELAPAVVVEKEVIQELPPATGEAAITEEKELILPPVLSFATEPKIAAAKKVATIKQKRGRKSLKDMQGEAAAINVPADDILFKKQYYSIGEVSVMFSLNTSLLRYWETEFDILKPRKNRKGDRHFRPEDIKNLVLIHHLLRQRKYTIEGAKEYLKMNKQKAMEHFKLIQKLEKVKDFLLELKAGL